MVIVSGINKRVCKARIILFSLPDSNQHHRTSYTKLSSLICCCCCFLLCTELLAVGHWRDLAQDNKAHAESLLLIAISSRANSTVRKYQAAFTRWKKFTIEKGFVILPSNPLQFVVYLEHVMKSTGSKSAVEEAGNALAWVYNIAGLQSPVEDGTVKSVIEGARRLLAKPVIKKEPVSADNLRAIVDNTNMSDLGDVQYVQLHCVFCVSRGS